jgi:hypothetical protein
MSLAQLVTFALKKSISKQQAKRARKKQKQQQQHQQGKHTDKKTE